MAVKSIFTPITYNERVAPLLQYKEVADKVDEEYTNLLAQAEELKQESTNNPVAARMYERFMTDLNSYVNDFSSNGLNANIRRGLRTMKGRYAQDIAPISKASKKLEEMSAEQRKLRANNPNLMFDTDFNSEVNIDQLIENPNLSYNTYDGNDIYNKGAAISKAMASRINSISPSSKLGGQYWEIREGFGEEAANQFLLDSGAIPELNKALEDLISSTGAPDKLKGRMFEYARQGAISGMVAKTSYQQNRGYESPADRSKRLLSERISEINNGLKPYFVDENGKKYYKNNTLGTSWSIDPKSTGTEENPTAPKEEPKGSGGKGGDINLNDYIDDPIYGDYGIKVNRKASTDRIVIENGIARRVTKEELNIYNNESASRIRLYEHSHTGAPDIREVDLFTINGGVKGETKNREDHLNEFNDFQSARSQGKTTKLSYQEFMQLLAKDKKGTQYVEDLLKANNLKPMDIVIESYDPGVLRDTRYMIRTKAVKESPNEDRSNFYYKVKS